MTKKSTIRKDNDIVRRDYLARLKAGPAAIAHLVRTEDGSKAERRELTDEVAEIGRQNRLEATGKASRRTGRGKSRKDTVAERLNVQPATAPGGICMTSTMTETGVCNMALDMLHEGPISSIDDDEPNARRFKRNLDALRDTFLAAHPWNFAVARASLPASAETPFFGWDYKYLLPGDCLRVLPLRENGSFGGATIAHEIEGEYILTDAPPPLKLRYVKRVMQMGLWSPVATTAFASFLAANLAHAITGKASYAQFASERFERELRRARRTDGMQGMQERADTNDVIAVRI